MKANRSALGKSVATRIGLGGSLIALAASLAPAAHAQETAADNAAAETDGDPAEDDENVIVVEGLRASLESSQNIKREADTIVDAIAAEDLTALPDASVSESLQRLAGINVSRFQAPNDPDHFSIEGAGVIVRGLPFTRSEFNGRDVFGASNGGAGIGFDDISPELLKSVVVFKNQSADLIEGGVAGVVDLRTRLPLDQVGQRIAGSIELNYSDIAKDWSESFSLLYSNNWSTGGGDFGLLVNLASSNLDSQSNSSALSDFRPYIQEDDGSLTPLTRGEQGDVYIPVGGSVRKQDFSRQRDALGLALQWESTDRRWLATAQFLRSESQLAWNEQVFQTDADGAQGDRLSFDGLEFDENGVMTQGMIREDFGWRGPAPLGLPLNGMGHSIISRGRDEQDNVSDLGFNLKFAPTDRWSFNFDAQYIDADYQVGDNQVQFGTYSNVMVDNTGRLPAISFLRPEGTEEDYFQNPRNAFMRAKMDHAEESKADQFALRGDAEYDFQSDGWLQSVRFGGRYASRDAVVRNSTFNWGNVTETWAGGIDTGEGERLLRADNALLDGLIGAADFSGFHRGAVPPPADGFPVWIGPLSDSEAYADTIDGILEAIGRGNDPGRATLRNRPGVIPGTFFLPSEITVLEQNTSAAYFRADFGKDFSNGMSVSGIIGLRYVQTDITSDGSFFIRSFAEEFGDLEMRCDPQQNMTIPAICSLDTAPFEEFFGSGNDEERSFQNSFDNWLPSFNLKWNVTDEFIIRLAASRAITRPTTGQLRADLNISSRPDINTGTELIFGGLSLGSSTNGNPFLEPITVDQFDVSFEYYFAPTGSLTLALFQKTLRDFWVDNDVVEEFTNNGVTLEVNRSGRTNSDESAKINGLEIAYQQFFDFLPGPLGGLGMQFNYSYIDANGVGQIDNTIRAIIPLDNESYPGVSEHQFNLVGLYQKGPIQARLAYNWRDEFILTRRDVITPFNALYQNARGQLDGSIFFKVKDGIQLGVQAVNLLDTITETEAVVAPDGTRAPRAFNQSDRRFKFVLRASF